MYVDDMNPETYFKISKNCYTVAFYMLESFAKMILSVHL